MTAGSCCFFFQAEDGIRDLVRSRGLGDVYKRQANAGSERTALCSRGRAKGTSTTSFTRPGCADITICLLYTSDAADERSSVDLGGRRIIKKKNKQDNVTPSGLQQTGATTQM